MKCKIILLFVILLFILATNTKALRINEIMYDLPGSDSGREWIEIYNNESQSINLTGWKFYENNANHALNLINGTWILENYSFAVIADNSDLFLQDNPSFNGTLFDSAFSLSNSNEIIAIKNSSLDFMDNVTYFSSFGASGDGNSLQFNVTWIAANPTPGFENNFSSNFTYSENETSTNSTNDTIIVSNYSSSNTFGSLNLLYTKFNASNYEYDKTRFLIYGSNQRIISDLLFNKITSYSECQGSTAVELNVEENKTYIVIIPFFIYPDCDNHYDKGNYNITLRICRPSGSSWTKYDEKTLNFSVSGKNSVLCPVCPSSSCSTTRTTTASSSTATAISTKGVSYSVIEYPLKLEDNFSMKVVITNNDETKSFEIWSYVYSGNLCYSEGCREGNKIKINVNKNSSSITQLSNQLILSMNEIDQSKSYKLKIKILKEGLKTAKEFTYNLSSSELSLENSTEKNEVEVSDDSNITQAKKATKTAKETKTKSESAKNESSPSSPMALESKSEKIKHNSLYMFTGLMTLFSFYLILRKD